MAMDIFSAAGICALFAVLGYALLQKAYPQPLDGIPYNRDAATKLTGDLSEIVDRRKRGGGSYREWFLEHGARHGSAISQVFPGPLVSPAVVVSDYREVHDILTRREGVDFKRGRKAQGFRGVLPHAFPAMESNDPRFKPCRDLVRDLMTPSVLHSINAPCIHDVAVSLVDLWKLKARLAEGSPFDVSEDVSEFAFDAVLSAAAGLGPDGGDLERQTKYLTDHQDKVVLPASDNSQSIVHFPSAGPSAMLAALRVEEHNLLRGFTSPSPWLYHTVNNLRPSVRRTRRLLTGHIAARIAAAAAAPDKPAECAVDHIVHRELRAAAANPHSRPSDPPHNPLADPRIVDQMYGYLTAGHDTSAGSLVWLLRLLTAHPHHQSQLRASLRATHADACGGAPRLPTAAELTRRHDPWLDAFVEEGLRVHPPVLGIMVVARRDTAVLGQRVPRGTPLVLNLAGPSVNAPSVAVEEGVRSEAARRHWPAKRADWDGEGPREFRPERWLREEKGEVEGKGKGKGKVVFDASAGPMLAFSAGNRGCWGRRLGYLELKIVFALMVWSFEFLAVPNELVSKETYDTLVTAPTQCIVRLREIQE